METMFDKQAKLAYPYKTGGGVSYMGLLLRK